MTGKHHLMVGTVLAGCITASFVINGENNPLICSCTPVAAIIGSMFPDIDIKNSKISQQAKITSSVINGLFGHRGFVHSPMLAVIIYFVAWALLNKFGVTEYAPIYIGFVAGFVIHLLCDMFTRGGIPLFSPFTNRKFRFTNLETGSKLEILTTLLICAACVGSAYFLIRCGFTINRLVVDFSWLGDIIANVKK